MRRWYLQFLYDGEGGGAGAPAPGPTPTGSPTPQSPSPASAAPAGAAPAGGAATGAAGTPAQAQPDRSTWIPPYRYNEIAERARRAEVAQQQLQQRVRLLMGVAEPPNPKHQELRQAFGEIMPELKPLLDNPEALSKVIEAVRSGQFEQLGQVANSQVTRHALTMTNSAIDQFATVTGQNAETLKGDRRSIARFAREFEAFVTDPEHQDREQRFDRGDPSLVREFVQGLVGFYIEPTRQRYTQNNTQQVQRARALPQGGPRTGAAAVDPAAGGGRDGQGRFANRRERFKAMREALIANQPGQ